MRSRIEIVLMVWPVVATMLGLAYLALRKTLRRWLVRLRRRARWAPSAVK